MTATRMRNSGSWTARSSRRAHNCWSSLADGFTNTDRSVLFIEGVDIPAHREDACHGLERAHAPAGDARANRTCRQVCARHRPASTTDHGVMPPLGSLSLAEAIGLDHVELAMRAGRGTPGQGVLPECSASKRNPSRQISRRAGRRSAAARFDFTLASIRTFVPRRRRIQPCWFEGSAHLMDVAGPLAIPLTTDAPAGGVHRV